MLKNVSLILTCSHFSGGIIRPNVPAIVEIGGIQVKPKPNPLPKVSSNLIWLERTLFEHTSLKMEKLLLKRVAAFFGPLCCT